LQVAAATARASDLAAPYLTAIRQSPLIQTLMAGADAVEWVKQDEGAAQIVYATEPNTTWLDRFVVRVIGVLPVKWMM